MATAPYFLSTDQFIGTIEVSFSDYNVFSDMATEIEEDILVDLLGYELYLALVADLDASNDPQTQKYIDLVDGIAAGYTGSDGVMHRLKGIIAMLPYLYYYYHVENVQSHTTEVGDIEISVTNSEKSIAARNKRAVRAWNKGLVYYRELVDFINYKNDEEGDDYYENFDNTVLDDQNTFGII